VAWNFDAALTTQKDQVRLLIGDTVEASGLLQDETIDWALTEEGNIYSAAALLSESLAGRFAGQADKNVGDLKLRYGEIAGNYLELSKRMRGRLTANLRFHTTGAESLSEKDVDEADSDLVAPFFSRTLFDTDATIDSRTLRDDL
jgi:hypothetical protein